MWAFDVADVAVGFARRLFTAGLKHELLLRPIGNTVYLMPPYILSEAEITLLGQQTHAAFLDVLEQEAALTSTLSQPINQPISTAQAVKEDAHA